MLQNLLNNEPDNPLINILLSNIRDGELLNLHSPAFSDEVLAVVIKGIINRFTGRNMTLDDVLIELEEVCFGPLPNRPGSKYILSSQTDDVAFCSDWYTVVMPLHFWLKSLSLDRLNALAVSIGAPEFPWIPQGKDGIRAVVRVLEQEPKGTFEPTSDFSLGYPVFWVTPRDGFEKKCAVADNRADVARDYLGLVHHSEAKHLIALHLPSKIIANISGARPIFTDAGQHRRFMVKCASEPPPYQFAWGQTTDLSGFEKTGVLVDGGPERVYKRITYLHIENETLEFEYLGRVSQTRGKEYGTDQDFARAQKVRDLEGFETLKVRL